VVAGAADDDVVVHHGLAKQVEVAGEAAQLVGESSRAPQVEGDRTAGSEETGDVAEETTSEYTMAHPSGDVEVYTDSVKTAVGATGISEGIFDLDHDVGQGS